MITDHAPLATCHSVTLPTPEVVQAFKELHPGEEHPTRALFASGDVRGYFRRADLQNVQPQPPVLTFCEQRSSRKPLVCFHLWRTTVRLGDFRELAAVPAGEPHGAEPSVRPLWHHQRL